MKGEARSLILGGWSPWLALGDHQSSVGCLDRAAQIHPLPFILKYHPRELRAKKKIINPLQTAPCGGACSTIYTFIAPPGFREEVFSWKHRCGVGLMKPPSSESNFRAGEGGQIPDLGDPSSIQG